MISKETLSRVSHRFHPLIHVVLGIVCGLAVSYFSRHPSFLLLPFLGIAGSVIPDIDHLFYMYIYGRKTEYSKLLRTHIKNRELRELAKFAAANHKLNTGVYSHNLISVLITAVFFSYFAFGQDNYNAAAFALGMLSHYIYDIFEDWLLLGRINPNWFLLFKREKINTPTAIKKVLVFGKLIRFFPNVLSAFPLFYGFSLAKGYYLSVSEFGFILLSILLFSPMFYGAIYIMDDIKDLELDKKHPIKSRGRAIASGEVSIASARRIFKILLFFSLVFSLLLSHVLFISLLAFLVLNHLYLFFLRKIPVVDLVVSTVLHSMKLVVGLLLGGVSPLLFMALVITDVLAYLSVAAGKRVYDQREGYVPAAIPDTKYYDYLVIFQYLVYFMSLAYFVRTAGEPGFIYRTMITFLALSFTVLYKPRTAFKSFIDFISYGDDREGTFTRVFNIKLWKREG